MTSQEASSAIPPIWMTASTPAHGGIHLVVGLKIGEHDFLARRRIAERAAVRQTAAPAKRPATLNEGHARGCRRRRSAEHDDAWFDPTQWFPLPCASARPPPASKQPLPHKRSRNIAPEDIFRDWGRFRQNLFDAETDARDDWSVNIHSGGIFSRAYPGGDTLRSARPLSYWQTCSCLRDTAGCFLRLRQDRHRHQT